MRAAAATALLLLLSAGAHAAGWTYSEGTDEVSNSTVHAAALASANSLELPAPDNGRNPGTLAVRDSAAQAGAAEVQLSIAKGHFACRAATPCRLAVRFDEQPPQAFTGTESPDGTNTLLLAPAPAFVAGARKARKIRIDLPLGKPGTQVLAFEPAAPLQWAAATAPAAKKR